ncbi:eukaryotic translation initiation factor 5B-like isoform X2 [Glandiceps talaboti]
MGKPKKGKKAKADGFDSDEEVDLDPLSNPPQDLDDDDDNIAAAPPSRGKKGKKNKRKDDWEDDILDEIEALKVDPDDTKKQSDDKAKEEPPAMKEIPVVKPSEPVNELDELEALADEFEADRKGKKGKKSGKKGAKKKDEFDDIDALVNEIEAPAQEPASKKKSKKDKKKDKKKKKKKDKDKEDEEKSTGKKKPGKAQVKAMQEALKRMKEDEERRKAEEEARIKAAEEAETQRLEKIRLEKEKKERDKQKRKDRIARLKAEGKYLTDKQKKEKARAEAYLAAMREQGLILPNKEEGAEPARRPMKPGRRRPRKQESQEEVTPKEEETVEETEEVEKTEETQEESVEKQEEEDEVKDAWDLSDDGDDEEEKEQKDVKTESPRGKAEVVIKAKDGEDDDDEEESDDESGSDDDDSDEDDSEEESDDDDDDDDEEDEKTDVKVKESPQERLQRRREEADKKRTLDHLRAPVVCVLGHVDTGKTKILDKIRRTHVQDGEAGGITQQIGATNIPKEAIQEQTKMCRQFAKTELQIPALLVIDTPGHESFSNLRSRGSSLCDIAILVVDIMHALEPQTIESINLLKQKKTPFVVALNKIDRLFEWKSSPHTDIANVIKKQKINTKLEFDERVQQTITEFAEQGLNAALFYENKDPRTYISMVPTSAHSGDGMGNLIALITEFSQTLLAKRLMYTDDLQCTVLEVKSLPGLGTTIDIVLVNGTLHEGDCIIVAGQEGPIVTQVRGLLMPEPLRELRVKNPYNHFKEIQAAQGVKVLAKDLDKAVAGTQLLVAHYPDEIDIMKAEVSRALEDTLRSFRLSDRGVFVQASTLGSLEALLEFLRTSKIPYAGINIGPVHRRDIMKAMVMLEHDNQYAVILAFDVKVEREAQELADKEGIKIFQADIIYHLFDRFMQYRDELKQKKRDEFKHIAVFPCKIRILPQFIFNSRDPIVVGVAIESGIVKNGTPICVPSKEFLDVGVITSIEVNHKTMETARKGQEVCLKIEPLPGEAPKLYGRHFDHTDILVSKVTRQSIDAVKNWFREDLQKTDWQLMIELKKIFDII